MGSILVFVSIILIILFIGAFLYLEIQNEKRLREIFTRRVKDCENDIRELNRDSMLLKKCINELITDVQQLQDEVNELQAPKAKTRKTGSSKR